MPCQLGCGTGATSNSQLSDKFDGKNNQDAIIIDRRESDAFQKFRSSFVLNFVQWSGTFPDKHSLR